MSRNDKHVSFDGRIRPELEPDYEELLAHRDHKLMEQVLASASPSGLPAGEKVAEQ